MEEFVLKKEYTGILNISLKPGETVSAEEKELLKDQIKGQNVKMCGTDYLIVDSWIEDGDIWYKAIVKDVNND